MTTTLTEHLNEKIQFFRKMYKVAGTVQPTIVITTKGGMEAFIELTEFSRERFLAIQPMLSARMKEIEAVRYCMFAPIKTHDFKDCPATTSTGSVIFIAAEADQMVSAIYKLVDTEQGLTVPASPQILAHVEMTHDAGSLFPNLLKEEYNEQYDGRSLFCSEAMSHSR